MKKYFYFLALLLTSVMLIKCTEAFDVEARDFDKAIVVEASITNENKFQEIKLSEAFKLDETLPKPITNAVVKVVDDNNNNNINFKELNPGTYVSTIKFGAVKNINYQLFIELSNGEKYESTKEKTISNSQVNDVKVNIHEDLDGNEEFRLLVDSYDPTGNSKYYRYTYKETYKIIAPYWSSLEATLDNNSPYGVKIATKTDKNTKVCYVTNVSNTILQTQTTDLSEDRVLFPIRKISIDDFIISQRYSIRINQYVQSLEAYTYYKVLKKFSNVSNLLSQSQPGFLSGNIYSTTNKENKIIGFFEVVSVSSKRIFFNYRDFFKTGRPDYIEKCGFYAPSEKVDPNVGPPSDLVVAVSDDNWIYYAENGFKSETLPGPYLFVQKGCGDCTEYGTNVKPSFWVD